MFFMIFAIKRFILIVSIYPTIFKLAEMEVKCQNVWQCVLQHFRFSLANASFIGLYAKK